MTLWICPTLKKKLERLLKLNVGVVVQLNRGLLQGVISLSKAIYLERVPV